MQCDTTDLYDPAFMCSPDNADLGGVFIVPINGPVPIVIMAGSVQHYEQYRAMVPYAFPLLRKLTVKQSIPPTRDAQDRVLATILSRSDQLTDRRHDYNPVCYVVQPNDAVYVPYSCIVRRGGFLPSDIARQVKTVPSTGSIQIHHFEFHISKAAIPLLDSRTLSRTTKSIHVIRIFTFPWSTSFPATITARTVDSTSAHGSRYRRVACVSGPRMGWCAGIHGTTFFGAGRRRRSAPPLPAADGHGS